MKLRLALFVALTLVLGNVFAEAVLPAMPSDVPLTNGRILHKVQVVRWETGRVVLKHAGGVDPVAFTLIAEPLRSRLDEIRVAAAAQAAVPKPTRTIVGQVFVTTKGAGAYKFAGARVFLLDQSAYSACQNIVENYRAEVRVTSGTLATIDQERVTYEGWTKALRSEKSVVEVTTDADGYYKLTVPAEGRFYVICVTSRLAGSSMEYNVWSVPAIGDARLDLNSSNHL